VVGRVAQGPDGQGEDDLQDVLFLKSGIQKSPDIVPIGHARGFEHPPVVAPGSLGQFRRGQPEKDAGACNILPPASVLSGKRMQSIRSWP
jgi:hypothetical protein